ncbi:MAG: nucleoid-associated protein [Clostridia bacterium]|nr:nucleoid-associated protein [Clostridia bacterium]
MEITGRLMLIIDDSPQSPIPQDTLTEVSEDEQEYLASLIDKLKISEDTVQAQFVPSLGTEGNYGLDDPDQYGDDELLANMQAYFLECMRKKEIELSTCDVLFLHARDGMVHHLCVLILPYRIAPAHYFSQDAQGTKAEVVGSYHLPPQSSNIPGMLINKSTSMCWIHDLSVRHSEGKSRLFRDLLYSFEDKKSVKEVIKAVDQTAKDILADLEPQERTARVKQAINESIEDSGAIDLTVLGDSLFPDQPDQSIVFTQQMTEAGVQEITPVAEQTKLPTLEKMRITTDNGVSISLPLSLAQDGQTLTIEENADGTRTIILRHIQTIHTR